MSTDLLSTDRSIVAPEVEQNSRFLYLVKLLLLNTWKDYIGILFISVGCIMSLCRDDCTSTNIFVQFFAQIRLVLIINIYNYKWPVSSNHANASVLWNIIHVHTD